MTNAPALTELAPICSICESASCVCTCYTFDKHETFADYLWSYAQELDAQEWEERDAEREEKAWRERGWYI
jgi:hypothetical protein